MGCVKYSSKSAITLTKIHLVTKNNKSLIYGLDHILTLDDRRAIKNFAMNLCSASELLGQN